MDYYQCFAMPSGTQIACLNLIVLPSDHLDLNHLTFQTNVEFVKVLFLSYSVYVETLQRITTQKRNSLLSMTTLPNMNHFE